MDAEALRLRIARAVIVVIVEPGFADRDHLGMTRDLDQLRRRDIGLLGGVVRMRPDRAEHLPVRLDDGFQLIEAADARRDGHDRADPGFARASEHGVELAPEVGKIEMAVAVDEHHEKEKRPIFFMLLGWAAFALHPYVQHLLQRDNKGRGPPANGEKE